MKFAFLVFLFLAIPALSQFSDKDKKKLERILCSGQEVEEIQNSEIQDLKLEPVPGYFDRSESIDFTSEKHSVQYISDRPALLREFNAFRQYVIDSVCRDRVYFQMENHEDASVFLKYEDFYDEGGKEYVEFDPSDRALNRSLYRLDWDAKLNYESPGIQPLVSHWYEPFPKRLYRQKEWMEKYFIYRYYYPLDYTNTANAIRRKIIDDTSSISYDFNNWINRSTHPFDIYSTLTRIYPDRNYATLPAAGISLDQAEAFCLWKDTQINAQLEKEGLPFYVRVRIASVEEMFMQPICDTEMPIPVLDKTEDWTISMEDYGAFYNEVADSVCRDCVYKYLKEDALAARMLSFQTLYFSESDMEYIDFDPADRDVNRIFFSFKKRISMGSFPVEVVNKCAVNSSDSVDFTYFYRDLTAKDPKTGLFSVAKKQVNIPSPDSFKITDKKASVHQSLSYDQAVAFYNWKYPVHRSGETVGWTEYVFPSAEEFEKLKKGERVYLTSESIHFPGSLFYYTIRVYTLGRSED
jgi:hypothetical protein